MSLDDVFTDLKTSYLVGETVFVADLPKQTQRCVVRTAFGAEFVKEVINGSVSFDGLPVGTHVMEALSAEGTILSEELFGVHETLGDNPVMGFATSFDEASAASTLKWLRDLRCTVVQMYDWMDSYSEPLTRESSYEDPLGRSIETASLARLIVGIKDMGAVAQAYAPVIAADEELANAHPEWRLFRSDDQPQSLGDLLQIMDPGSAGWQRHWIDRYGEAADTLGFNGFHLDTYGYPRLALDKDGDLVDVTAGYESFVEIVRKERSNDVISFNQVNGVPRGFAQDDTTTFGYVEIWPPNTLFRHFEGLLQRSARSEGIEGNVLAIYPPVWSQNRGNALRTCLVAESVLTMLGATALIWGDNDGVLSHPYYVNHETLSEKERSTVLDWHRFGLRCRDLFRVGSDTSWFELSDENASVMVQWEGASLPEPAGGSLFVRVRHTQTSIVIGLLDLTGSLDGSWSSHTEPGRVKNVEVSVLLDAPERWTIDVSAVDQENGRFTPLESTSVTLREGLGVMCRVSLVGGWTVLRMVLSEVSPA